MGSATRASVRLWKCYNPHIPLKGFFTPVGQRGKFHLGRPCDFHRTVRPYNFIGAPFRRQCLFPAYRGVIVNRNRDGTQMKAHVITLKRITQNARDNMFPGMLLHMVKTARPVDPSGNTFTGIQRMVTGMDNHAVMLMHIRYRRNAQYPLIGRLSAAFGIKCGSIQYHLIIAFARFT